LLEEEGHIARDRSPLGHLTFEHGEVPRPEARGPGGAGLLEQRVGQLGLAPDHAPVEEAERHPEVLRGDGEDLGGAADRVVEADALVPDGVPDGVGHALDVPVAVVHEHDIEVAVGAEGTAAIPADGDQRQVPALVARDPLGQAREPGVGLGGVAAAEILTPEPGLGEQGRSPVAQ
jgi:hypothetical protein